jgi:hypothetical protein
MVEFQLDDGNLSGKITPDVGNAHVEPCQASPLAMCFDYHTCLLFVVEMKSV